MNNVITINLNGNAYQLEEKGYTALKDYLDKASAQLKDNPDKDEILTDLEQAIAEKCSKVLSEHKSVVLEQEIHRILEEMGPVNAESEPESEGGKKQEEKQGAPKRLYQIREGAMISGVCNGLAAYFNIDVTLVRIIFVILAILTHGAWILVYIIMMFVVPFANTGEEKAAAYGMPFNAQELVDRARESYEKYAHRDKEEWERWSKEFSKNSKEHAHRWKQQWEQQWKQNEPYMGQMGSRVGTFFIALLTMAITLAWVYALISLLTTGAVLGLAISGIPIWVVIVAMLCLYNLLLWPLRSMQIGGYRGGFQVNGRWHGYGGWYGMWDGIMWMGLMALAGWGLYTYVPAVQTFVQNLPFLR